MCGVAGIISHSEIPEHHLKNMSAALRHRGPDGFGYMLYSEQHGLRTWLNQEISGNSGSDYTVGFAHRRLSIIDLSTASLQPMVDETEAYCLVYNGEIYNYVELKAELEKLGYSFKTTGDAEVVLRAYQAWGPDCFRRFNGMWALALFDRSNQLIVFSRDRLGIKPLYYTIADGMLYFASEIKSLLAIPTLSYSPNERTVANYLLTGHVDETEETFFEGIYSFPAGHWASVPLKSESFSMQPFSYWSFPVTQFAGTEQDATQLFQELFIDSVRIHARSDVPVGTCLSGGLDSSSIVCTAELLRQSNQIPKYSHQAFGYCPYDGEYSEKRYMDEVVSATSLNMHHVVPPDDQMYSCLPAIIRDQDEPFGSASILAQWFIFQRAQDENIKVMLDGQGADESLAGYHEYFRTIALILLAKRDVIGFLSLRSKYERNIGTFPISSSYFATSLVPDRLTSLFRTLRPIMRRVYSQALRRSPKPIGPKPSMTSLLREALSLSLLSCYSVESPRNNESTPLLNQVLQLHMKSTVLPALLRHEDRNSMAHSIEARVPFLDYRLIDFIFTLPDHWRINGIWTKYILRQAMKGILPESIRTRIDKIGFRASPSITFNYVRDNFTGLLNSETDLEKQWLNQAGIERLFYSANEYPSGDFVLWRFLNLKLWVRQHWG